MLHDVQSIITNATFWQALGVTVAASDLLRQVLAQRTARHDQPEPATEQLAEHSAPAPRHPSRRVGELHRAAARRRTTPAGGKSTTEVRIIAAAGRAGAADKRTPNRRRPGTRRP